MVLTGSALVDETREENNKGKGPAIDCAPFRPAAFFIGLLECLVVVYLCKRIMDTVCVRLVSSKAIKCSNLIGSSSISLICTKLLLKNP